MRFTETNHWDYNYTDKFLEMTQFKIVATEKIISVHKKKHFTLIKLKDVELQLDALVAKTNV